MIFPLPLTTIEHYMLAEDTADYPMCFHLRLRFAGRLDREILGQAIVRAVARHPLLRACVEYRGETPWRWVACEEPGYEIDELDAPGRHRSIDLRHEPGLRFAVGETPGGVLLEIEFHHACTDGLGAVQFLGDLLRIYAALAADATPELPPIDIQRLRRRGSLGLVGWRRVLWVLYGSIGWLGAIEYFSHRPAPLPGSVTEDADVASPDGLGWQALTQQETASLIGEARADGVTVNDRLLTELFHTVQDYITERDPAAAGAHKRVMAPTSLRAAGDERTPAANIVAIVNLDRRPHRWKRRERMLRVLHWEMSVVKRMRLGVVFIQLVAAFRRAGLLGKLLPRDRCLATCVISNLGRVLDVATEPRLEAVEFYPPIRPLTRVSLGVVTHEGRLAVSLRYDARCLTAAEGAALLDGLVERLRRPSPARRR